MSAQFNLEDELEKLFLVEILVDSLQLEKSKLNLSEADESLLKETCVCFKILDLPPLTICEEDFCEETKHDDLKEIVLKSGKSCLFSIKNCSREFKCFNVSITVIIRKTEPPNIVAGKSNIILEDCFLKIINSAHSSCDTGPIAQSLRDKFVIKNENKEVVGNINVFFRLSCFGKMIITQFQVSEQEKETFLFVGKENVESNKRQGGAGEGKPTSPTQGRKPLPPCSDCSGKRQDALCVENGVYPHMHNRVPQSGGLLGGNGGCFGRMDGYPGGMDGYPGGVGGYPSGNGGYTGGMGGYPGGMGGYPGGMGGYPGGMGGFPRGVGGFLDMGFSPQFSNGGYGRQPMGGLLGGNPDFGGEMPGMTGKKGKFPDMLCGKIQMCEESSSESEEETPPPPPVPLLNFCSCDYPLPPGFFVPPPLPPKKKKKKKKPKCPFEIGGRFCVKPQCPSGLPFFDGFSKKKSRSNKMEPDTIAMMDDRVILNFPPMRPPPQPTPPASMFPPYPISSMGPYAAYPNEPYSLKLGRTMTGNEQNSKVEVAFEPGKEISRKICRHHEETQYNPVDFGGVAEKPDKGKKKGKGGKGKGGKGGKKKK